MNSSPLSTTPQKDEQSPNVFNSKYKPVRNLVESKEGVSAANSYESQSKPTSSNWLFVNVIAIVVVSSLANLYFASDGSIPAWKFIEAIPYLFTDLSYVAAAAGLYIFSFLIGLFGLLRKSNRTLGFILASWVGLLLMMYVSSGVHGS